MPITDAAMREGTVRSRVGWRHTASAKTKVSKP